MSLYSTEMVAFAGNAAIKQATLVSESITSWELVSDCGRNLYCGQFVDGHCVSSVVMPVHVRHYFEDPDNCRDYFTCVETGRVYALQNDIHSKDTWYSTTGILLEPGVPLHLTFIDQSTGLEIFNRSQILRKQ